MSTKGVGSVVKTKLDTRQYLFSAKALWLMIAPLIIEQLLTTSIGMIDSVMVASVGETAVSAVFLVDTVMILLINFFVAIATGGGIVAGQKLGMKRADQGSKVIEQTLLFAVTLSLFIMMVMYIGRNFIFTHVFGEVEFEVFRNARTYYLIMSGSIPFLALYVVGASAYRAMGNAVTPMIMSLAMNIIHLVGNYVFIHVLHNGIAGAAFSSLLSRIFSGVLTIWLLRRKKKTLHISTFVIRPTLDIIKEIMQIAIPFGVENSLFQLGKILTLSLVTSLGTAAITANAIASNVGSYAVLIGASMGVALSIVTAQCVGAKDFVQVRYYVKKIMKYAYLILFVVNAIIIIGLPAIMWLYKLSPGTEELVKQLIIYHSICAVFIWPPSFMIPSALRAASDVKYCMVVAVCSMWVFRIGFSYVLVRIFDYGIVGVWMAMTFDWLVRAVLYFVRYYGKEWEQNALLKKNSIHKC